MSFYDDNDNDIRSPDEAKRETLLEDNRNDFDKELEEALYQSFQLYENEMHKNEEFEQKIIEEYKQEIEKRKEIIKPILFELNRIKNYDNKICKILEILEPILELYCGLVIQNYAIDNETYNFIFNGLTKIRVNLTILKSIIQSE